jgi:hypothetical protein
LPLHQARYKPTHPDQNPEALATFAAMARNDGKRPKDHPLAEQLQTVSVA